MDTRLSRWARLTEWPLTVVAAVFLGAYSWLVLRPPRSPGWHSALDIVDYAAWAIFAVDYAVRVAVADLAVVVLPLLRPLRLLRLVLLLRALNRWAVASLRGRVAVYVTGAAMLLIYTAALAVLDAERHQPGAELTTFGRALWWAFTTVTTVGYGDYVPVTGEGRVVAVGLMIGGVAIISVITGSFASWLIDRVRAEEETARAATTGDVHAMVANLERNLPGLVAREVQQLLAAAAQATPAVDESTGGASTGGPTAAG